MKLLAHSLCLCLALALAWADHHEHHEHHEHAPDRCQGIEFDAVAVNEEGVPYFFEGHYLFKGFHGQAERSNDSFAELDEYHHLGHVDAAFRMHFEDNPSEHDHLYFFLDNMVFSYYKHKLEEGYPKKISEVFPGIPDHLDAAVVCPKPECDEDTVIFFKGHEIYHYNVKTKAVVEKDFNSMPNCTSAFRFLKQYYCFHGHLFSKFDPKTGEVDTTKYPKEARDYFMRCSKYSDESDHAERERCSHVHLDAITGDSAGNISAFRGHHFLHFLHKDGVADNFTANTIEHAFKELHSEVDAVFVHDDHFYMIKGDQVFVYRTGEPHTHLDGYPKPLKEVLGIEGHVDAAFLCEGNTVHIVQDQTLVDVDLSATPRVPSVTRPISRSLRIDAAMCHSGHVVVITGNHYYNFDSVMHFLAGRDNPEAHKVSQGLFRCDH